MVLLNDSRRPRISLYEKKRLRFEQDVMLNDGDDFAEVGAGQCTLLVATLDPRLQVARRVIELLAA